MHQHGYRKTAIGGAAELLGQHGVGQSIKTRTAPLGRVAHAQQAEPAHLAEDLARDVALLFPAVAVGKHAGGNEPPDGGPQHRVLVAEIGEAFAGLWFGHAFSLSVALAQTNAPERQASGGGDQITRFSLSSAMALWL